MNDFAKMSLTFLLLAFMVIMIIYFNPVLYKAPWALERLIEVSLVLLYSNFIHKVDYHEVLTVAQERILKGNFSTIDLEMMKVIDNILVFEYSGIIYFVLLASYLAKKLTKEQYRKSLDFDELLAELSKHFRFARCMIHLDPTANVKEINMTEGPFRLKDKVVPFFEHAGAVGLVRVSPTSPELNYLIRAKADAACLTTLGRRFSGVSNLREYEKWLFAAFCYFLKSRNYGKSQEYKNGEAILGDISYYFNGEGGLKRVNRLTEEAIVNYQDDTEIRRCCDSHFFVSGVLRELYHQAKSRGTFPSFHFNWLYTVDRTLMLVLDDVGMPDERGGVIEVSSPESGIECLYPRLHWTNEKLQETKLYEPACSYIIDYIEDYLVKVYQFIPEQEAIHIISEQNGSGEAGEH